MLWLALRFRRVALAHRPEGEDDAPPFAIVQAQGPRRVVTTANRQARALGVREGQAQAEAQALCAELRTEPRSLQEEETAMNSLALWALRYSSLVARFGEDLLLIEIGASCLLFGNERDLLRAIADDLAKERYEYTAGVAATASAARLFARSETRRIVRDARELRAQVGPVELQHGDLPESVRTALAGIGVRRYDALLRLPRSELGRRFGQIVPQHLDHLLGRNAETLCPVRAEARFHERLEWGFAMRETQALLFPLRRLIVTASRWLVASQKAALSLKLALEHEDHPPSEVEIGLGRASADFDHLLAVARARIERLALPQGVVAMRLDLPHNEALAPPSRDLFVRHGESPEDAQQLLDRLQGRLGDAAVLRYALADEHRPERAASAAPPSTVRARAARGKVAAVPAPPQRPLLLLDPPQPLAGWPGYDERRARLGPPERIETGWWDDADVRRDYHRLDQPDGSRLWVFRNRNAPHDWFVQGVYA